MAHTVLNSPRLPESEYAESERNFEFIRKYQGKPFKGLSLPSMIHDQISDANIGD
jgi:hypothetical protein